MTVLARLRLTAEFDARQFRRQGLAPGALTLQLQYAQGMMLSLVCSGVIPLERILEVVLDALGLHGGSFVSPVIRLYGVDELIERNETYETKKYCPGYLTIGDDSGGQAIVIAIGKSHGPVFIIDHGSMDPDYFTEVAPNLETWIGSGFSVHQ